MKTIAIVLSALVLLACMTPALPLATPQPTAAASVPTPTVASVNTETHINTCTIIAVTVVNVRECGSLSCAVVGEIIEGQTVTGICSGDWMMLGPEHYACLPALIGTGGCD